MLRHFLSMVSSPVCLFSLKNTRAIVFFLILLQNIQNLKKTQHIILLSVT